MIGAEAGQHITITVRNMSTNELIARAIHKGTTFGTANIGSTGTNQSVGKDGGTPYAEGGDNVLNVDMLAKFYTFDKAAVTDPTIDVNSSGAFQQNGVLGNTLDDAPTAVDFVALNAFARSEIQDVSQQRSDLGAIQNRLEHTINNLDNIVENTTYAESAICDTDIATEMVKYANNNILQQTGTSMLSQANQTNQTNQMALALLG